MPLSPCTTVYGSAEVVAPDPVVARDADCLYRPFSTELFFDRDPSWGIYGYDGRLAALAAYTRGTNGALVGQSSQVAMDLIDVECETEPHVYFGPLIPHYGHFLVSSLARAWFACRPEAEGARLLCHSDQPVAAHFEGSYMGALTSALGLDVGRFTRPTTPTRFTRLTIPGPAFLEQQKAHEAFLPPMHRIGDALLGGRTVERTARPIYLSKSRMRAGSVANIANEAAIEDALRDRGVDIVHPETLTLGEQLHRLAACSHVLGFAGSAFHTHVFLRKPPAITAVTLDPLINANFLLLDRLNRTSSRYLYPDDNIESVEASGFGVCRRIKDVRSFVRAVLDAAELPSRELHPMHITEPSARKRANNDICVPDHEGESYKTTLGRLHAELQPRTYLEIGTLTGETLKLSRSPSIAIDPRFQITTEVIGDKEACLFFQLESDRFFERQDPKALLGRSLDFCFLDGMHRCEFLLRDFINAERHASPDGVIALHDCIPVETPMTDRAQCGTPPILPHRGGWWTGDVWRTVVALRTHRPDLRILCLDAAPTGLVLVSGLDPSSTVLKERTDAIIEEMMGMDLDEMTIPAFFRRIGVKSTADHVGEGRLLRALGLAPRASA